MDKELTEFLIEQFATLATKDELKSLATKKDLKGLATKDDLKGLATKAELAELRSEMNFRFARVDGEIAEIKIDLKDVKDKVTKLDKRSDEDIRATMKDVEKIKLHLKSQGVKI